jgi:hypothetical protein
MRNSLQYIYTILVFSGALTTSYLMIAQQEMRNQTRTAQNLDSSRSYRREAAFDSGVTNLFEIENALARVPAQTDRMPADSRRKSNEPVSATPLKSTGERSGTSATAAPFPFLQ